MNTHTARFGNNETMEIRELDDGSWACPVCGWSWPFPPITPIREAEDVSRSALGEVCQCCKTEFGVDEGSPAYAPIGTNQRVLAELRARWLDSVKWSAQALTQLQNNLGITEEQARAQAKATPPPVRAPKRLH